MTRRLIVLAMVAGLAGCASATARDAARDEREIRRVEAAICAAFEHGDGGTLQKYLDERFTLTSSRGEVTGRSQNLAEVLSREPRYEVFRNHDQQVRLYGDSAIVLGVTTIKATVEGKPFAADFRFTDTYVRHDGRWVLAASHASRLVESPQRGATQARRPARARNATACRRVMTLDSGD